MLYLVLKVMYEWKNILESYVIKNVFYYIQYIIFYYAHHTELWLQNPNYGMKNKLEV